MASEKRVFSVTELVRVSDGQFTETPMRFEWDSDSQSSPRSSWKYGIKQRTVREDYPGGERTSEQVLGFSFEPFTVAGVWDDRHARTDSGGGFAVNTLTAFERLVRRGNFVRIELEGLTITGIITAADFDYLRASYIRYEFTVSPHFRYEDEGRTALQPRAIVSPKVYADDIRRVVDEAKRLHDEEAPAFTLDDSLKTDILTTLSQWIAKADIVDEVVNSRVLVAAQTAVNGFSRLAQTMQSLRGSAQDMLNVLATARSDAKLAYESAVDVLDFEVWSRGLAFQARLLAGETDAAQKELERQVDPSPIAIYRPYRGENLYGISQRFYGTPHHWRDVADANGLKTFSLNGDEVLLIPELR